MPIHRVRPRDREGVRELLEGTGAFQPHEMAVAMELVDITLTNPDQQDYDSYVLEKDGAIVAYACFGRNPMTRSTYDLYWIATRADRMRNGYGREIFAFVEKEIRLRGGRLLVIETSSRESYRGSQIFYTKIGCALAARLDDFYDEGDDKLIYSKRLG